MPLLNTRFSTLNSVGIAVALIIAAALITIGSFLSVRFPSEKDLPWHEMDKAEFPEHSGSLRMLYRFADHIHEGRFSGDISGSFRDLEKTGRIMESAYLPAGRVPRKRVFNAAVQKTAGSDAARGPGRDENFESAYSLYVPSGTSAEFDLAIPAGSRLFAGARILPDAPGKKSCDSDVSIVVDSGGKEIVVYRARISSRHAGWHKVSVGLPESPAARFRFITEKAEGCSGRGRDQGRVLWSDPAVYAPEQDSPAPNLVYISINGFGARDMGAMGDSITPNMNNLAKRGTLFTGARSTSGVCRASQVSSLFGMYASRAGLDFYSGDISDYARKAAWPALAAVMRAQGYETAVFSGNGLFSPFAENGIDTGFAVSVSNTRSVFNTAELVVDAVKWISGRAGRPFFLHVNFTNPAGEYRPPREYVFRTGFGFGDVFDRTGEKLHLAEVAYADNAAWKIFHALERMGLDKNTLVIVQGACGEILINPKTGKKPGDLSWRDSAVHVPLLMVMPGRIKAGQVRDAPVSMIDLAPTVLGIMGIDAPWNMHGSDLLKDPPTPFSLIEGAGLKAIYNRPYKYVRFEKGDELLFKLTEDADERVNLAKGQGMKAVLDTMRDFLESALPESRSVYLLQFEGGRGRRFIGTVHFPATLSRVRLINHAPSDVFESRANSIGFRITGAEKGERAPVLAVMTEFAPDDLRIKAACGDKDLSPSQYRLGPGPLSPEEDSATQGIVHVRPDQMKKLFVKPGDKMQPQSKDTPLVRIMARRVE